MSTPSFLAISRAALLRFGNSLAPRTPWSVQLSDMMNVGIKPSLGWRGEPAPRRRRIPRAPSLGNPARQRKRPRGQRLDQLADAGFEQGPGLVAVIRLPARVETGERLLEAAGVGPVDDHALGAQHPERAGVELVDVAPLRQRRVPGVFL